ncbi:MAG: tetratricopeptide repeat protein [bacterium]
MGVFLELIKQPEEAIKYYEKAYELGETKGYLNLGLMHKNGEGFPVDKKKAVEFFEIACEGGIKEACEKMEDIH